MRETSEKQTEESRARKKEWENEIKQANIQLDTTKRELEEQLHIRSKQFEDERIAREQIEASLQKEEKKRVSQKIIYLFFFKFKYLTVLTYFIFFFKYFQAALKRHLKNKLKDQMKSFEKERNEMSKKYEEALIAAREEKQKSQFKDSVESRRARDEIMSLASGQNSDVAVKKLEKELAKMKTQLELQRQQTQDERKKVSDLKEVVQMRESGGLHLSNMNNNHHNNHHHQQQQNNQNNAVHLTPRHEKMQKMHIQHEVEREQHHERVRQERERQKAELRERLERKKQRPSTTSVAPGHRPSPVASAWGDSSGERKNGDQKGSGGRSKGERSNYNSGESRQIQVRSKRAVVDFTCEDEF